MAIAINPDEEQEYVLECDRALPREEQTRFYYKPMPADRYYSALDSVIETRAGRKRNESARSFYKTGSHELSTLLGGLTRVENLSNARGEKVMYPADGGREAKLRFISMLRPAWRKELAEAIAGDSEIAEGPAGESASPSASA